MHSKRIIYLFSTIIIRSIAAYIIMQHAEQLRQFKIIGAKVGAFVFIYNECVKYYKKEDFIINVITVVGAFVLGSGGIPAILSRNAEIAFYFNILINILTICIGVIGFYAIWANNGEKIGSSRWASSKYSDLFNEIQKIIIFDTLASTSNEQKNRIIETILDLNKTFPAVSVKIYNIYKKEYGDEALTYKELYDNNEIILLRSVIGTPGRRNWKQELEKFLDF